MHSFHGCRRITTDSGESAMNLSPLASLLRVTFIFLMLLHFKLNFQNIPGSMLQSNGRVFVIQVPTH